MEIRAQTLVGLPWRTPAAVVAAAALVLVSAYGGYRLSTRGTPTPPPPPATALAERGTLVTTLTATGTSFAEVQSKLSFTTAAASTGAVIRTVDVQLGDRVAAGQPLATLDRRSAERNVEQATIALEAARLTLAQLTAGAPADVAAGAQAVAAASAAHLKAQNDLATLRRGAEAADLAAARQAVLTTQDALSTAQEELDVLQARARARIESEAVQRELDAMNAQLSRAETEAAAVLSTTDGARFVRPALVDLTSAVDERCKDIGNRSACSAVASAARDLPSLVDGLNARTQGFRDLEALARAFMGAVASTGLEALEEPAFRQAQALAARRGLQARHEALIFAITPFGSPSPDDLLSAIRLRDAAAAAHLSAQERVRKLVGGATAEDLGNAELAIASARAAFDAALAAQAALGDGGRAAAVQQQQVLLAEVSLRRAHDALEDTVLRASFAGVVAFAAAHAGDPVTPGVPLFTITDPAAVGVRLTVSERDVARIAPGQLGVARFAALPEQPHVIEVAGVGRVPAQSAGLGTYEVRGRVLTAAELRARSSSLSPLMSLLGEPANTEAARSAVIERLAAQPLPFPGMAATVTIAERVVEGALLVPVEAVRKDGDRSSVLVRGRDGSIVERAVTLGVRDRNHVEVLAGLDEGETVVLDVLAWERRLK